MKLFSDKLLKQDVNKEKGKTLSCPACGLYKNCNSPRMKAFGRFKKGILNIGEAPGEVEDKRGKPWQGKAGQALQSMYSSLGIDLFEDCLNVNTVNCRTPDNRTPSGHEISCCRKFVLKVIKEHKPKVIILLGGTAVQCLIGYRWTRQLGGIMKWRGFAIPDSDFEAWICPVFHPSFVLRSEERVVKVIWKKDLERAFHCLDEPFPQHLDAIRYLENDLSVLSQYKGQPIAFDYETTGIKPHAKGHRVICASVAVSEEKVYTFMMPQKRSEQRPFLELLEDKGTPKLAHNIKYEDHWSKEILRTQVQGWRFDSMLAAHVLDNRPGICSLKFQTYVNFGSVDYETDVFQYLQAVDIKNGNSFNRIHELIETEEGQERLLKYCALDSLFEYRLATLQMEKLKYSFIPF
jgi:DNA polymerase